MLRTTWHSQQPSFEKTQFAGGVAGALPEHDPLLEQEAFVPSVDAGAAEPAGAAPFALHDDFAPAAAGSVAAGGLLPPQPASTPNMIPDAAETARTLPIFIWNFSWLNTPQNKGVLTSPAN